MPPTVISGLPAHVLLVHAVIVLVPAAALAVVLAAWWPAARLRLGLGAPLLALVTLLLVPVTTHAGQWLRVRVADTPLIRAHVARGHGLLPWVAGMFVVAAAGWYVHRAATRDRSALGGRSPLLAAVCGVLVTVLAVGSVVQVVRIGESGSRAIWKGSFSSQPRR